MDPEHITEGAIFILSLFILALLTAGEMAFYSISRLSLEKMRDDGIKRAALLLRIYQPRQKLHSITALGRAIAVVAGTVSVVMLTRNIALNEGLSDLYGMVIGGLISLGGIACSENLFSYAMLKEYDEGVLPRFASLLYLAYLCLLPLTHIADGVAKVFQKDIDEKTAKEEELRNIVESESEEGVIEEEEKDMIHSIFEFADTTVREVMVPRIDMVCAERSTSLEELLALITEKGHSRIPIYEEKIDNICGMLYVKDMIQYLADKQENWRWNSLLRAPYFVPENKKIDHLLKELKDEKIHIAIVVDEYGGTAGLVTLEDLLEEIVGEIQDEYDEEKQLFHWIDDTTLLVDARIDIHDLSVLLDVGFPEDGFETLGGFIYHTLDHIPEQGETLNYEGLTMSVDEINAQRISKVKIVKHSPDVSESNGGEKNGSAR